jgi:hypothetical protein
MIVDRQKSRIIIQTVFNLPVMQCSRSGEKAGFGAAQFKGLKCSNLLLRQAFQEAAMGLHDVNWFMSCFEAKSRGVP